MVRAHLSTLASDLRHARHPGLAKQPCPGRLAWCQPYPPEACTVAWTVQLKSSHPPAYDHWYLDGHFLLVVQQPGGMATGQGERQAEVHRKVQMVWCLNMLPSGMPSLEDINLDEDWTCSH